MLSLLDPLAPPSGQLLLLDRPSDPSFEPGTQLLRWKRKRNSERPTCSMTVLLMWCLVAEPPFPFILALGSNSMLLGLTNSFLFLSSTLSTRTKYICLQILDVQATLSCIVGTSTAASASLSRLISSGATWVDD